MTRRYASQELVEPGGEPGTFAIKALDQDTTLLAESNGYWCFTVGNALGTGTISTSAVSIGPYSKWTSSLSRFTGNAMEGNTPVTADSFPQSCKKIRLNTREVRGPFLENYLFVVSGFS